MRRIEDIFSLNDGRSIPRTVFRGTDLDLRSFDLPIFEPDGSYKVLELETPEGKDQTIHYSLLGTICQELCPSPDRQKRVRAALREAVKNAYQHGNKKDSSKKIVIAYRNSPELSDIVVGDQGGIINPQFVPFVLAHRYRSDCPQGFYQFAVGVTQPAENAGVGTYTMHLVCDEVKYHRNKYGGLSVQLIIKKANDSPASL